MYLFSTISFLFLQYADPSFLGVYTFFFFPSQGGKQQQQLRVNYYFSSFFFISHIFSPI